MDERTAAGRRFRRFTAFAAVAAAALTMVACSANSASPAGSSAAGSTGASPPASGSAPASPAGSSSSSTAAGSGTGAKGGDVSIDTSGFGLKPDPKVQALLPADIESKGEVVNVFYNNSPPNDIVKDGKLIGVQVDFANAASEVMGLKFNNVVQGNFSSIIPGLQGGRYDISFSGVGITSAREQVVDIVSFYQVGIQFAVNPGHPVTIAKATDLCGLDVGELAGSQYVTVTKELSDDCTKAGKKAINIQQFPTDSDAVLALQNGRVQAYGQTSINVEYEAKQANLKVEPFIYDETPQGVAVPKGSAMGPVLQAAMKALVADGTYQKILDKWQVPSIALPSDKIVINPKVSD